MTLYDLINNLIAVASNQPSIKMVVKNDIFRLNERADAKYGVFAFVQGQHTTSADSSFITYSFTLFYVDRLKNDMSNQIEIQSVGVETLDNIIRALDEIGVFTEQSYSFQVFNQRFLDECAGVFCNVALSVPRGSVCAETFNLNNNVIIY